MMLQKKQNIKEHNLDWSQIPDHLYRILIIRGSGSGKTNSFFNLLNQQSDIEKPMYMVKTHMRKKLIFKKRKCTDLSILTILKILFNTEIIWMILTKILRMQCLDVIIMPRKRFRLNPRSIVS